MIKREQITITLNKPPSADEAMEKAIRESNKRRLEIDLANKSIKVVTHEVRPITVVARMRETNSGSFSYSFEATYILGERGKENG